MKNNPLHRSVETGIWYNIRQEELCHAVLLRNRLYQSAVLTAALYIYIYIYIHMCARIFIE